MSVAEQSRPIKMPDSTTSSPSRASFFRTDSALGALRELLKAHEYAFDARCDKWNFAIEINALSKFGLSDTDLRWLIIKDFVQHKRDASGKDDLGRCFENVNPLKFQSDSCFVLTNVGAGFVNELLSSFGEVATALPIPIASTPCNSSPKPVWDLAGRQLRVVENVVKHFRWPARNQELVLTVFQEEGWPKEIDDPLVPIGGRQSKERLHDTIKNLNRSQKIRLIQFRGNGTGEGIVWQYTGKANKLMGINSFIEDTTSVASGVVAL